MQFSKKIKKISAVVLCALLFAGCAVFSVSAAGTDEKTAVPVYADSLNEGIYPIEVSSSASMFKIVACELTVSGSDMTAVMTLSGKGYEKLYLGTGEQALAADEADYIFFAENAEGKYTYTLPVEALDKDIDCAAFSFKKQQWYDRVIVFRSETLPEGALKAVPDDTTTTDIAAPAETSVWAAGPFFLIALVVAAAALVGAVVAVTAVKKKKTA